MNPKLKKLLSLLIVLAVVAALSYFGIDLANTDMGPDTTGSTLSSSLPQETQNTPPTQPTPSKAPFQPNDKLDADGFYYDKEDVALFIHTYGRLPDNFVTKSEARSEFGSNYKAMKAGYRIGGDRFGNREGRLPAASGRTYTECDIVAEGGTERGACRIVFSNDGLVYYTSDHYNSFTLLYGEP